ncbi:mitochondrial enoyl-CoA hydratase (crotonase) [Andalucia godoyi]|uniref:Mitochondrial enoyl-CoA hydratase (Crotonase) n=1 Tax=Andalucia godoyi TaxID=505711 RepID=A0A8K0AIJ0_ANDGO|nr:mitochondrial enoyl-CoA hydratase (crotonase) [Andalucia godoyi]|eukprot:ANDGO_06365.mRNA.1 mitochondrial enoyl-CoA hydratase (crotonase)
MSVRAAIKNGVVTLTLSNPGKLNCLTDAMGKQFASIVASISHSGRLHDEAVRAVVLTGEDPAFSSGGDMDFLKERIRTPFQENVKTMRSFYGQFLSMRSLRVPLIAAVNGVAIGAGLCLACAADIRIVEKNTRLGLTFTSLGLHAGMGATHILPRVVRRDVAMYLLQTGAVISGQEALDYGLALKVVEGSQNVVREAQAMGEQIAKGGPDSVGMVTQTLRMQVDGDGLEQALEREAVCQATSYASQEYAERLQATINRISQKK